MCTWTMPYMEISCAIAWRTWRRGRRLRARHGHVGIVRRGRLRLQRLWILCSCVVQSTNPLLMS